MKKNYSEPKVRVQTIALQSMMQSVSTETGEGGASLPGFAHDRSDLLDDWDL